ncbi:MAG: alcohol dehydrogenase catalytic domain-containing protein [Actinobacteria bacterium]|jgi:L-iditol 2-dehydrogenase|nr:alcohol dehydrogenase catalytic domain-containing protein [Actinomycetota bacterium]
MTKTVRAAVMVKPGHIEVRDLPYPDHLEPGAVIVKMQMSGICGTDKHAYNGELTMYAGTESEQQMVFPSVHGHENTGTVVEMNGNGYDLEYTGQDLKLGDRITHCPNVICGKCWYCRNVHGYPFCAEHQGVGMTYYSDQFPYITGGWAEYLYLPPGAWIYKVPDYLPVEYACLSELFVVAALLDRAKEYSAHGGKGFHSGDTVAVQGVGPIGMIMIAKARMLGAGKIIAIDASNNKLERSHDFGADVTLNITELEDAEIVAKVREETSGRGADVVVETAGRPQALIVGLDMLRRGGTYLETGNFVDTGEKVEIDVHRHIAAKNVLIYGNTNHPHDGYYSAFETMWRNRDRFPFDELITHKYPLSEAPAAMQTALGDEALKVVLVPDGSDSSGS